jgi:hypothetical protein
MSGVLVTAAIEGAHRSRGEPSGSDSTRWLSFAPTSTTIEYGPERSRGLERRHRGHWLVLSRGAAAERARSPSTSAMAAWSRRWPTRQGRLPPASRQHHGALQPPPRPRRRPAHPTTRRPTSKSRITRVHETGAGPRRQRLRHDATRHLRDCACLCRMAVVPCSSGGDSCQP